MKPLRPARAAGLALQVIGWQFALGVVLGLPLGIWSAATHQAFPAEFFRHPGTLSVFSLFSFGLVILQERRRSEIPWRSLSPCRGRSLRLIPAFVLLSLGTTLLCSELINVLRLLLLPFPSFTGLFRPAVDIAQHPFAAALAVAVVAPFTEEILFRGLILRGLLATLSRWRAVLLSAAWFGAIHLNPPQVVSAFALGLVTGWVFSRTHSLGLCLLGHALNNTLALLATLSPVAVPGFTAAPAGTAPFQPWWLDAAAVILFAIGAISLHRRMPPTSAGLVDDAVASASAASGSCAARPAASA